ncbi:MAG: glutathione S-transferase [Myxococcales bacterium]|nr:glutathione S-transferase [Myxococcales bacterium]
MITVHHLNNSRSQRVLWLLEELELPYEIVKYERDPKTLLAPPSLQAIHPLGKSPVITDGDKTIAESAWILEYLVETHGAGRLVPKPGTQAYRDYRYFMHYAEGSLMPFLLLTLIFTKVKTAPMPFFAKPIAKKIANGVSQRFIDPNLTRHLTFLGDHLAKNAWFAGDDFTAADIQMSFALEGAVARAKDQCPAKIVEMVDKMHARPAYQRALAKGGPYEVGA